MLSRQGIIRVSRNIGYYVHSTSPKYESVFITWPGGGSKGWRHEQVACLVTARRHRDNNDVAPWTITNVVSDAQDQPRKSSRGRRQSMKGEESIEPVVPLEELEAVLEETKMIEEKASKMLQKTKEIRVRQRRVKDPRLIADEAAGISYDKDGDEELEMDEMEMEDGEETYDVDDPEGSEETGLSSEDSHSLDNLEGVEITTGEQWGIGDLGGEEVEDPEGRDGRDASDEEDYEPVNDNDEETNRLMLELQGKAPRVAQSVGGFGIYTFEVQESDLYEQFIRGGGPGGQAVNKTRNCVLLKHLPTGTIVKCQTTRFLAQNRKIARRIMALKLEQITMGAQSKIAKRQAKIRKKKLKQKQRQKKRAEEKKLLEHQEGTHQGLVDKGADDDLDGENLELWRDVRGAEVDRLREKGKGKAKQKQLKRAREKAIKDLMKRKSEEYVEAVEEFGSDDDYDPNDGRKQLNIGVMQPKRRIGRKRRLALLNLEKEEQEREREQEEHMERLMKAYEEAREKERMKQQAMLEEALGKKKKGTIAEAATVVRAVEDIPVKSNDDSNDKSNGSPSLTTTMAPESVKKTEAVPPQHIYKGTISRVVPPLVGSPFTRKATNQGERSTSSPTIKFR